MLLVVTKSTPSPTDLDCIVRLDWSLTKSEIELQEAGLFDETTTPPVSQNKEQSFLMRDVGAVVGEEGKLENNNLSIEDNLSVKDDELRIVAANIDDCGQDENCAEREDCDVEQPVCKFKRGVCKLHYIKGKKQTIEHKKWKN